MIYEVMNALSPSLSQKYAEARNDNVLKFHYLSCTRRSNMTVRAEPACNKAFTCIKSIRYAEEEYNPRRSK